jgi:radical SAM protein with 4Fe4S-binding SPASM domain
MLLCIMLTNRCSMNCLTCINSSNPRGEYGLSTETIIETMNWLAGQQEPQIDFTGGEPFVRHDIHELIRHGKNCNIVMNMCTNGWNIEERDIPLLCTMRRITLTFYGLENFHDRITGVEGSYKKACRMLSFFKDTPVRIRANVVTLASALHDLPELACELQRAGAGEIKFSMMLPRGRALEFVPNLLTSRENDLLMQLLLARKDLRIPYKVQSFDKNPFKCCIPEKKQLFLASDGRIYPCPAFLHSDYDIGRVEGKRPISESFEKLEWFSVLNSAKHMEENRCPALELGVYAGHPDVLFHESCPPFAERLADISLAHSRAVPACPENAADARRAPCSLGHPPRMDPDEADAVRSAPPRKKIVQ